MAFVLISHCEVNRCDIGPRPSAEANDRSRVSLREWRFLTGPFVLQHAKLPKGPRDLFRQKRI